MRPSRTRYVLGLGLALGTALLLVLAAGALGIVGAGGAPDRPFLAVPVVLVLGTVAARLRPASPCAPAAAWEPRRASSARRGHSAAGGGTGR